MWPFDKEPDPYLLKKVEHLVITVASMRRVSSISCFGMRVQGRSPITGGTTVVHYRPMVRTLDELKHLIHSIFYGVEHPGMKKFIERAERKVTGAYACCIDVTGYDQDGDMIEYDLKFANKDEMLGVLKHGMFSLKDKKHSKYRLIGAE